MATGYKTRAWWTLRALTYGAEGRTDYREDELMRREAAEAMDAAMAPAGDPRLRVLYPDGAPVGPFGYSIGEYAEYPLRAGLDGSRSGGGCR